MRASKSFISPDSNTLGDFFDFHGGAVDQFKFVGGVAAVELALFLFGVRRAVHLAAFQRCELQDMGMSDLAGTYASQSV